MLAASERLHAAIVESRLRHPGHPDLDRQVASAIAKPTGRGWRLDKSERSARSTPPSPSAWPSSAPSTAPRPVRVVAWL